MNRRPNKSLWAALIFALLIILGCGGGGGGVAPSNVDVFGNVVWIETGSATAPQATVRIGDVSAQTDAFDGYFSLTVPAGATSLTVTYAPTSTSTPIVRTFTFPAAATDRDLGEIYIGPDEVIVTGILRDSATNSPVSGGNITIAGRAGTSAADGRFSVPNVAYSGSTLSVFLGLQGRVTATGYFTSFFNPPSAAVGGVVDVGTVLMTSQGSGTPPPIPSNVNGTATPNAAGATIQVLQGPSVIRTTTVDGLGQFKLWLPAGTYTVQATLGSRSGSTPLTISDVQQIVNVNVTLN